MNGSVSGVPGIEGEGKEGTKRSGMACNGGIRGGLPAERNVQFRPFEGHLKGAFCSEPRLRLRRSDGT